MARVLFLSVTTLKSLTILPDNIEEKLIEPVIRDCQDMYIHPILGTGLFNEIKTQITAGTTTDLNKTLLDDYVIPCLIEYIRMELVSSLTLKLTNKTAGKKSGDNLQPLGLEDIMFLMEQYKNKAEWRAQRVTLYLKENSTSYPLFDNPGTGCDVIKPNNSNYTCGMVLDDDYTTDWNKYVKYKYGRY